MEAVRLVIWDLDCVFWDGTLTEGGMKYRDDCHHIVVELAGRGIMSSICSKNNFDDIKAILQEKGIWDYFIFPSISWDQKGHRLARIVENTQLRPETVMFIDDNKMNLAEAAFFLPSIQLADENFIPSILADKRFQGKDDRALTRLAQYKVLQQRKADETAAGDDSLAFLRASGIRVVIDYDVEQNLDRAIELINRTNQLNFTKARLPENLEAARSELRTLLDRYDVNAGLVKVVDNYGDYGYVGFFAKVGEIDNSTLLHFCFSCRTLNMGIETWVYRWIGSPNLATIGEVLVNVVDNPDVVDWIEGKIAGDEIGASVSKILDRLVMRGGCDLAAISHYLAPLTSKIDVEVNSSRDSREIRIDHSSFLQLAFGPVSAEVGEALSEIGYLPGDWTSALSHPIGDDEKVAWFLSFWVDSFMMVYQHQQLDFSIPFTMPINPCALDDVTALDGALLDDLLKTEQQRDIHTALCRNFRCAGVHPESLFRQALQKLVAAAGDRVEVFIILAPESWKRSEAEDAIPLADDRLINKWIREEVSGNENFHLFGADLFNDPDKCRSDSRHFERLFYHKLADAIIHKLKHRFSKTD